jgi:preprotein translocase subunit SecG
MFVFSNLLILILVVTELIFVIVIVIVIVLVHRVAEGVGEICEGVGR